MKGAARLTSSVSTSSSTSADGVSRAAIGRLFRERLDPLDVIKWREIYLELENAIDAGEDAAEAIERMIHKRV